MANWEKLNAEFDNLIDNMSIEDWNKWKDSRSNKRKIRKSEMLMKAKMRSDKLLMKRFSGKTLSEQKTNSSESTCINISSVGGVNYSDSPSYALAA